VEKTPEGTYLCRWQGGEVASLCVILAEGVESRLARSLGWNTALSPVDIETCAFARVTSPLIEKESCVFYTGSTVAPGGYAWIFPRGRGDANVGLGMSGSYSTAGGARKYLLEFIDRELPGGRVRDLHCGGVPVGRWLRPLVKEGIMLVGDAARQVSCLSGAGIAYALYAGNLAGKVAAESIVGGVIDYAKLRRYQREWKKNFGAQQDRSFTLKEFIRKTDDPFLNKIAASLSKEPPSRINYLRVFSRTFAGRPLLLLKAIRLFK
jgi:digeranylgeranylglycerophospholipid reductase